jgi:hypothetical protein
MSECDFQVEFLTKKTLKAGNYYATFVVDHYFSKGCVDHEPLYKDFVVRIFTTTELVNPVDVTEYRGGKGWYFVTSQYYQEGVSENEAK